MLHFFYIEIEYLNIHACIHAIYLYRWSRLQETCKECPFCNMPQSRLLRHIEKNILISLKLLRCLSFLKNQRKERIFFSNFKKEGIFHFNQQQVNGEIPTNQAQRKGQDDLVASSKCKRFNGRRFFHRHRENYSKDDDSLPKRIHSDVLNVSAADEEFGRDILSNFTTIKLVLSVEQTLQSQ